MFDSDSRLSGRAILLAVLLVGAVAAGGIATAKDPLVDDGTISGDDTATDSELTPHDTLGANNTFEANGSHNTTLQYQADSNNSKVVFETPVDGENVTVYENASPELVAWNNTDNDGHFNVSVSHDELADVPRSINENVTVYATIINNTESNESNETTFPFYIENSDTDSVMYVADSTVANNSDVGVEYKETLFSVAGFNVTDPLSKDWTHLTTTRDVNGSATDVVVILDNDSAAADYEDTFGSADAGTWKGTAVHYVGDEGAKAYASELPDDIDADASAVTYTQVDGQDALVIDVGEEHSDANSVDVESYSSVSSFAYGTKYDAYGGGAAIGIGGGGVLLIGYLFIFGRVDEEENSEE